MIREALTELLTEMRQELIGVPRRDIFRHLNLPDANLTLTLLEGPETSVSVLTRATGEANKNGIDFCNSVKVVKVVIRTRFLLFLLLLRRQLRRTCLC